MTRQQPQRARDCGITFGVFPTGAKNGITDVAGVKVGHVTLASGDSIRTGVTAILPHGGNIFQEKVPAAIFVGNGYGKLAGYTQVEELGTIETPIVLTNTLSVPTAADALLDWTLFGPGNGKIQSINSVVGETNDGMLNDIRGRHVRKEHVLDALRGAHDGAVEEGNVGAGTGTVCFGWKGGIGTSSRKLPGRFGSYTIGVLAQTNFGGILQIAGVPIGLELKQHAFSEQPADAADGSCMIVVATDAPLCARNLKRLAARAMLGLGRTGGSASNGSGDYVMAFSTAYKVQHDAKERTQEQSVLRNDAMSPLFQAVVEATEEAIINSLFAAETMTGTGGKKIEALPRQKVLELMKRYGRAK